MNNKKILFLINKLGVGGAEKVFIKDANALIKDGMNIHFAFLYGGEEDQTLIKDLDIGRENIFYPRFRKLFDFGAFLKFSSYVKKNEINVIYSTLDESNIISRFIKIFNPSIEVIIREANVAFSKPFWFKFIDLILNIFVKKIISVSSEVKKSLEKYQPFYAYKNEVLMNGVFIPESSKKYSEGLSKLKILNVGSLTEKKGQKFLLEACSLVEKQRPGSFQLDFYGEGVLKESLNKKIKELNLENIVRLNDLVSFEKLSQIYIESDLFVLSSLWEGCPNVLLEAMAHGLCSISTKVSGANDIVINGISGILVERADSGDIANAIIDIIDKRSKMSILGNKAREMIIKEFSFDAHINRLKKILL